MRVVRPTNQEAPSTDTTLPHGPRALAASTQAVTSTLFPYVRMKLGRANHRPLLCASEGDAGIIGKRKKGLWKRGGMRWRAPLISSSFTTSCPSTPPRTHRLLKAPTPPASSTGGLEDGNGHEEGEDMSAPPVARNLNAGKGGKEDGERDGREVGISIYTCTMRCRARCVPVLVTYWPFVIRDFTCDGDDVFGFSRPSRVRARLVRAQVGSGTEEQRSMEIGTPCAFEAGGAGFGRDVYQSTSCPLHPALQNPAAAHLPGLRHAWGPEQNKNSVRTYSVIRGGRAEITVTYLPQSPDPTRGVGGLWRRHRESLTKL
ncbi:hypothetical protein B0H17DRAFT_1187696 [Mycena rosella]|uniref:Uncharacterized protein n=1 Tax=Mycena rosella TaxID=1033263 RepID=A0AAD7BVH3_MYCRO|nr:hypothetical protein B0H17DRAFT_1187696 [Mycena rosella]